MARLLVRRPAGAHRIILRSHVATATPIERGVMITPLADLIERQARAVRNSPVFEEQLRLGTLAEALVAKVLGPIQTMLEEQTL